MKRSWKKQEISMNKSTKLKGKREKEEKMESW
jgi:hypothetical protein